MVEGSKRGLDRGGGITNLLFRGSLLSSHNPLSIAPRGSELEEEEEEEEAAEKEEEKNN